MSEQEVKQKELEENQTMQDEDGVSISVGMKVGYMYSFLFQHLHRSFRGIFGLGISIAALVAFVMSLDGSADMMRKVILLVIGLLFTVVNPLILLVKAVQQVKLSPIYKQPLEYTFSESGMRVAQEDNEQYVDWNQVLEIRKTPTILIIYTARNAGSIIAFREMGDSRKEIEAIIAKGCKEAGVKKIPAYLEREA